MIHLTRDAIARSLERLLHIHDSPHRTAVAFSVGVFIGFSPLLGLHTVLGLAVAFAFSLNRVAVLLGVYVNLPWFLGPYYTVATLTGAALVGTRPHPGMLHEVGDLLSRWAPDEWHRLFELLRPFLLAYTLGSTLLATLLAGIAYYAALGFVIARRSHHAGSGHTT